MKLFVLFLVQLYLSYTKNNPLIPNLESRFSYHVYFMRYLILLIFAIIDLIGQISSHVSINSSSFFPT